MSIQTLQRSVGGTIETYFNDRQITTCHVSLYTGQGAKVVDAAVATIDSVSTTLTASADALDTQITVASTAGIVVGRRYLLGQTAGTYPNEVITFKSVDSATLATSYAPLAYAHANGSTLKGTRVSYAVTSTVASILWWDGWADWVPGSGDQVVETVDCAMRKIPEYLCAEPDVYQVFQPEGGMLSSSLDMQLALRDARDWFLFDLGGSTRAQTYLGQDHFRRPCAIKFWLMREQSMGEQWQGTFKLLRDEYDRLITKLRDHVPADVDQDGSVTGINDGGSSMISLERS